MLVEMPSLVDSSLKLLFMVYEDVVLSAFTLTVWNNLTKTVSLFLNGDLKPHSTVWLTLFRTHDSPCTYDSSLSE